MCRLSGATPTKYDYENMTNTNADNKWDTSMCGAMGMTCLDRFGNNIPIFDKVCLITYAVFCPPPWCTQGGVCIFWYNHVPDLHFCTHVIYIQGQLHCESHFRRFHTTKVGPSVCRVRDTTVVHQGGVYVSDEPFLRGICSLAAR